MAQVPSRALRHEYMFKKIISKACFEMLWYKHMSIPTSYEVALYNDVEMQQAI